MTGNLPRWPLAGRSVLSVLSWQVAWLGIIYRATYRVRSQRVMILRVRNPRQQEA
jgi:hypothetical protein